MIFATQAGVARSASYLRHFLAAAVFFCFSAATAATAQVNSFPYTDSFEAYSGFPAGDWTVSREAGTTDWEIGSVSGEARTGVQYANSSGPATGAKKRLDLAVDFSTWIVDKVSYHLKRTSSTAGTNPNIKVQYSTDGVTFVTMRTIDVIDDLTDTGYTEFIDPLPSALNNVATAVLRWEYDKDGGGTAASVRLDDVEVTVDRLIPVELFSFSASVENGEVVLQWATASETENLGFHLYRRGAGAEYERLTSTLIPGQGTSVEMGHYSFRDSTVFAGHRYQYRLADIDFNGRVTFHPEVEVIVGAATAAGVQAQPRSFAMYPNYPNPFNPSTTLHFQLDHAMEIHLAIYDAGGRLVRTLFAGKLAAGEYRYIWLATNDAGVQVASGVYFGQLRAGGLVARQKLLLAR